MNSPDRYGANTRTDRRVALLEQDRANVEDVGAGTSRGRIEPGLLKITGLHADSPTAGVRMYIGNLYARGTAATATKIGVTVRIPDIAADVTAPTFGTWGDVRACAGIRVFETWTGATASHSEFVYYAVGPGVLA